MKSINASLTLTVVGYYGKYPTCKYATSCYLLQGAGQNIVIDMGSGALLKLTKFIDPQKIDTIILSHLHGDHIADIFAFKNIAFERKGDKVRLFAPQTPQVVLDAILDGDLFEYQVLQEGDFSIGNIACKAYAMTHPLETYGIKFKLDKSVLAYTSDTLYNDNLPNLIDGAGLVLADACILQKDFDENSKHIPVAVISALASGKPVILSHLFCGKEKEILAEALEYNRLALLAEEGLSITI